MAAARCGSARGAAGLVEVQLAAGVDRSVPFTVILKLVPVMLIWPFASSSITLSPHSSRSDSPEPRVKALTTASLRVLPVSAEASPLTPVA